MVKNLTEQCMEARIVAITYQQSCPLPWYDQLGLSPFTEHCLFDIVLSWVLIGAMVNLVLRLTSFEQSSAQWDSGSIVAKASCVAVWQRHYIGSYSLARVVVVTNAQTILEESADISDASKSVMIASEVKNAYHRASNICT